MNRNAIDRVVFVVLVGLVLIVGWSMRSDHIGPHYEDGQYRGAFIDGNEIQVNVEFRLKDGTVTQARFRHLHGAEHYFLGTEEPPYRSVVAQYQEALDYLVGKDLKKHLADLYHPEHIVAAEVHGYTAATVRSNKIISAIRDALNRGVYSY